MPTPTDGSGGACVARQASCCGSRYGARRVPTPADESSDWATNAAIRFICLVAISTVSVYCLCLERIYSFSASGTAENALTRASSGS